MKDTITLAHGSGGYDSAELMKAVFAKHFANPVLARLEDAATVEIEGAATGSAAVGVVGATGSAAVGADGGAKARLAIATDTFVVKPLFFPGGDIGKLAVCGTVNDVLMSGAEPRYLACGFVLETGLPVGLLDRVCASMEETAREAGVAIVAGDTKVIEGEAGLIINTTGVGVFRAGAAEPAGKSLGDAANTAGASPAGAPGGSAPTPAPSGLRPGDRLILSGALGEHHACILSARMGIQNGIRSDCALLTPVTRALAEAGVAVHAMRDVTRGGLATVLNELAAASSARIEIDESKVPVTPEVRAFCGILGLDPLTMGNEGKMVFAVAEAEAGRALAAVRSVPIGSRASLIGEVYAPEPESHLPPVLRRTAIGGKARVDLLFGEGLPRIC